MVKILLFFYRGEIKVSVAGEAAPQKDQHPRVVAQHQAMSSSSSGSLWSCHAHARASAWAIFSSMLQPGQRRRTSRTSGHGRVMAISTSVWLGMMVAGCRVD